MEKAIWSPSFPERTQNRVHEIGIVPDVLEIRRLLQRLEKFKENGRSAVAATGK
jgi:hypothetical protein